MLDAHAGCPRRMLCVLTEVLWPFFCAAHVPPTPPIIPQSAHVRHPHHIPAALASTLWPYTLSVGDYHRVNDLLGSIHQSIHQSIQHPAILVDESNRLQPASKWNQNKRKIRLVFNECVLVVQLQSSISHQSLSIIYNNNNWNNDNNTKESWLHPTWRLSWLLIINVPTFPFAAATTTAATVGKCLLTSASSSFFTPSVIVCWRLAANERNEAPISNLYNKRTTPIDAQKLQFKLITVILARWAYEFHWVVNFTSIQSAPIRINCTSLRFIHLPQAPMLFASFLKPHISFILLDFHISRW